MYLHSVDYRPDSPTSRRALYNRGHFLGYIPRSLLVCRLLGHRPVVDGTTGFRADDPGSRWVCCDRCGVRPEPQGAPDPARWNIGDRYTGPWLSEEPPPLSRAEIEAIARAGKPFTRPPEPGPWPTNPTGALGAQLIIGRSYPGWSIGIKLGNCGSEHTLAAHISLHPFGALYLHTERFGTWLQRRLNPRGYQSRVTELRLGDGRLEWALWARRDSSDIDPWWMRGSITLDPRDRLFGHRRYTYEKVGDPTTVTVRLPHGDEHTVTLQLERCDYGRTRRRRFHSWAVDWSTRPGIPTKPGDRGRILGSGVEATAPAVTAGTWPAEAAARIALQMSQDRERNGYRPASEPAE
ncbi:hypothetical protein ACFRFJ_15990 [Streptomyces hydrogenans]|uniref:hypothetical protein n=1 Tax=Streptomyces hydrogenans TaxID=1873719 RepID=UPI0036AC52F2